MSDLTFKRKNPSQGYYLLSYRFNTWLPERTPSEDEGAVEGIILLDELLSFTASTSPWQDIGLAQ
jgi:hypothetical protein